MEIITQAQAKARGLERYHGTPCKFGHTERYTNSRGCVVCPRIRRECVRAAPKSKPVKAAPVEAAPPADERPLFHRDPGQWCDPRKIDAAIERIFNNGPRLGVATLRESAAA
jgi:hypothetical protein